ncbi:hypothetical protein BP6252_10521 [Coleophoma cylindrospora]|uniref:Nucleoporin NUP188 n=1 Tax=Coleophoma cylindrospora TaxID=1849047 RepID=A0A3D8QT80_9HELO|nr:hypothetical protein BP6252_10521 [Coleophoma cylindrospora]
MVPLPESMYLPPLDKILAGEQLSWKTALNAIASAEKAQVLEQPELETFLADPEIQRLLASPLDAFSKPSAQTRSTFETKTSAINVTPSATGRFEIKQVKEDALWLSKEAGIDEVSALRVVIEESQSRASIQLRGPFSYDEITSVKDAAGNSRFLDHDLGGAFSEGVDSEKLLATFNEPDERRGRILRAYLSERLHLRMCAESLLRAAVCNAQPATHSGKGKAPETQSLIQRIGDELIVKLGNVDKGLLKCIASLREMVENISNGSGWLQNAGGDEQLEIEWMSSQLMEAKCTMEIMLQLILSPGYFTTSAVVLEWFQLLASVSYFERFNMMDPSSQALGRLLSTMACLISLAILKVGLAVEVLGNTDLAEELSPATDRPYVYNSQTLLELHKLMLGALDEQYEASGLAAFGWCAILTTIHRRTLDEQVSNEIEDSTNNAHVIPRPDMYSEFMEAVMDSDEDPLDRIGRGAFEGLRCFGTISYLALRLGSNSNALFPPVVGAKLRVAILDLVAFACTTSIGYREEVVDASLATLSGGRDYWDVAEDDNIFAAEDDPIAIFLATDDLRLTLLESAARRYPFESLPFLKLVHATAACASSYYHQAVPSILDILEELPVFTSALPDGFINYETTAEEDNNNNIRLTTTINLFEARTRQKIHPARNTSSRSLILAGTDSDFTIPYGTLGRIISESRPRIVMWWHQYSGLKYFGKLLETFLTAGDSVDATTGAIADREAVAEIIGLLSTLIVTSVKASSVTPQTLEQAHRVLETASAGLTRSGDIVSVVSGIFEEELQRQASAVVSEASLDVLDSCVQFLHAIMPLCPGRVWPIVARSGMLENGRSSGWISSIVGTVESITGQYTLLLSCTHLYEALVEDFVTHAVARKCGTQSPGRFGGREELGTGVPEKVLSTVLLSFTHYMVDVLESSCTWRFSVTEERHALVKNISITLETILCSTHSISGCSEAGMGAMAALMPAASHILNTFVSTSGTLRFQPLLRSYIDGLQTSWTAFSSVAIDQSLKQVQSVLSFTRSLLQTAVMQVRPATNLESLLFRSSPIIARLYAAHESFRLPVVALFKAMIASAASSSAEPPSLLGHLGPETSKAFLQTLSDLDGPLPRTRNVILTWQFLCTVVTGRQQWFANYLLTGKTPRDAMKKQCSESNSRVDKSLLSYALERLSKLSEIPKQEALAMLEFVSLAQNHLPWTMYDLQKHESFIKGISNFVGSMPPLQPAAQLDKRIDSCYTIQIAAFVAQILAMHLFHSRQMGDTTPAKELLPNLTYFTRFAVAVPDYNASLHGNLKRNFESRYPGCPLGDFKRTTLETHHFGRDYLYNLSLANKMLSFDEAWTGRKDDGYGNELATANVNLSIVDAQIAVLNSWKLLATELSSNVKDQVDLQKIMAKIIKDCMVSNSRSQFSEEIFARLKQTRADLALVLLQRLLETNSTVPELYGENGRFSQGVLSAVWEATRSVGRSFGLTLSAGDATYHRSLLRLLYLALRLHADAKPQQFDPKQSSRIGQQQTNDVALLVLEIIDNVVANGFRDLAAALHDQPDDFSPEDIALITGILQTSLRIPSVALCHSQIVSMMATYNTARVAANLFSWSDKLAINGDPIYGELSILFLLELSSIPAMAEHLATEGLLSLVSDASITTYLRRPNISPFADGTGPQRCYSIWVRGILPLLLNILHAVGISIATEVALFLNQFPHLLKQSSTAFDSAETSRTVSKSQPKYITLSVVSEVHSTALILFILNSYKESGMGVTEIPGIEWDAASVLENVEIWLGTRGLLRERILPMGKREQDLSRRKADSSELGARHKLEEMVVSELIGIRDVLGSGD